MKNFLTPSRRSLAGLMIAALLSIGTVSPAAAEVWTYRGQLLDAGQPANGFYDVEWIFFDEPDPRFGKALAEPIYRPQLAVKDGELAVELEVDALQTETLWLEVRVRRAGEGDLAPLLPRQNISPRNDFQDRNLRDRDFTIQPLPEQAQGGNCDVNGNLTVTGNLGIGTTTSSRLEILGNLGRIRFDGSGDLIELTAPSDVRLNASSASTFRLRVAGDDRLTSRIRAKSASAPPIRKPVSTSTARSKSIPRSASSAPPDPEPAPFFATTRRQLPDFRPIAEPVSTAGILRAITSAAAPVSRPAAYVLACNRRV